MIQSSSHETGTNYISYNTNGVKRNYYPNYEIVHGTDYSTFTILSWVLFLVSLIMWLFILIIRTNKSDIDHVKSDTINGLIVCSCIITLPLLIWICYHSKRRWCSSSQSYYATIGEQP